MSLNANRFQAPRNARSERRAAAATEFVLVDEFGSEPEGGYLSTRGFHAWAEEPECRCSFCDYGTWLAEKHLDEIEMAYSQLEEQLREEQGFVQVTEYDDRWGYETYWVWEPKQAA